MWRECSDCGCIVGKQLNPRTYPESTISSQAKSLHLSLGGKGRVRSAGLLSSHVVVGGTVSSRVPTEDVWKEVCHADRLVRYR